MWLSQDSRKSQRDTQVDSTPCQRKELENNGFNIINTYNCDTEYTSSNENPNPIYQNNWETFKK